MKIGMSTSSFFGLLKTEDALEMMGKMGVKLCEVFLDTFSEYEEEFVWKLKAITEKYGMEVYSIHAMGLQFESQLFSVNERQREDAFRTLAKVLRAADILGAKCYTFHGTINLKRNSIRRNYTSLAEKADHLLKMCENHHVQLAWENVHWCTYAAPGFAKEMLERVKENLYFTLDIKQAMFSNFPIEAYIEDMQQRIRNVHICDYRLEDGAVRTVLPGEGDCDFPAFFDLLRKNNYDGPAMIEVYRDCYSDFSQLQRCYEELSELVRG